MCAIYTILSSVCAMHTLLQCTFCIFAVQKLLLSVCLPCIHCYLLSVCLAHIATSCLFALHTLLPPVSVKFINGSLLSVQGIHCFRLSECILYLATFCLFSAYCTSTLLKCTLCMCAIHTMLLSVCVHCAAWCLPFSTVCLCPVHFVCLYTYVHALLPSSSLLYMRCCLLHVYMHTMILSVICISFYPGSINFFIIYRVFLFIIRIQYFYQILLTSFSFIVRKNLYKDCKKI